MIAARRGGRASMPLNLGAAGYSRDLTIERMYRDARACRIGEGKSEMQKIRIACHLLGGRS